MTTAKEMANSALVYLDFDNIYSGGASADERQFGLDFGTACVEQISTKLEAMNNVTVDTLNNEFKKLLTVTQSLNDSDFSFAINSFRENLLKKLDMQSTVGKFLSEENITEITNDFYGSNSTNKNDKAEIAKQLSDNIKNPIIEQLNTIPLEAILEYIGAEKKEPDVWKITETGHTIRTKNQVWKNFHNEALGMGGISLLTDYIIEVNNIKIVTQEDKKKVLINAIEVLVAEFGHDLHLNKEQDKLAQVQVDKEESSNPRFKM